MNADCPHADVIDVLSYGPVVDWAICNDCGQYLHKRGIDRPYELRESS